MKWLELLLMVAQCVLLMIKCIFFATVATFFISIWYPEGVMNALTIFNFLSGG